MDHIDTVLASCTRSLYALQLLRTGLASPDLHNVTMATTMARMLNAALVGPYLGQWQVKTRVVQRQHDEDGLPTSKWYIRCWFCCCCWI